MDKIQKLTAEQEAQLLVYREEWRKIGLSTEPANMDAVKPVMIDFYKRVGKPEPEFWHCRSPLEAHYVIAMLRKAESETTKGKGKANANALEIIQAGMQSQSNFQPSTKVMGALMEASMSQDVKNLKLEYETTYIWGSWDAYWVAYYLFPHLYLRPMHTDEQMVLLREWETLVKNSGWIYTFENLCIVCDRPERILLDEQNRLHCDTGPALKFRDGYSIYSVNGVVVPDWIIEHPDQITAAKVRDEGNTEVRRVMMKMYGWERWMKEVNAELVDKHPDPHIGELWKFKDVDDTIIAVVRVLNGTPEPDGTEKWYTLRVRPQFTSVVKAVKSTYPSCANMSDEEFLIISGCRT